MEDDATAGRAGHALPPAVVSWIWAAGSAAWLAPALLLTFGLVSWLPRLLWPAFGGDHGLELGALLVTWGAIGMAGTAALARILLGGIAVFRVAALMAALGGLVIAAALQVALHGWAVSKFGYFEPEVIGLTALLPFGLAALATALFGISVAPRAVDFAPRISVVIGGLLALATVALNLPGAVDGVAARAVPLAIALAVSSVWVVSARWIAVRR